MDEEIERKLAMLAQVVKLRNRWKQAQNQKCNCSSFAIQYDHSSCSVFKAVKKTYSDLMAAIDQLS